MGVEEGGKTTVLVVIDCYLPGYRAGGPIRSLMNMISWLSPSINFYVMTRDHDIGTAPYEGVQTDVWQSLGEAQICYLSARQRRIWNLQRFIQNISYDVLFVDGFFSSFSRQITLLHRFGKLPEKPIILSPRGHLESGALSIKPIKKYVFMAVARLLRLHSGIWWHATSQLEYDSIQAYQATPHVKLVPDLPAPVVSGLSSKRNTRKEVGHARLVFLSRISRKKNLDLALKALRTVNGKVTFDLYGPLEDKDYWKECEYLISLLPSDRFDVTYKGVVGFDTVINTLCEYDLFVLPTRGENFGYVILEALSAGCPPLISDRTPWMDLNEHGAGWVVPLDNQEQFTEIIQYIVDIDHETFTEISMQAFEYAKQYLDSHTSAFDMLQFFQDVATNASS